MKGETFVYFCSASLHQNIVKSPSGVITVARLLRAETIVFLQSSSRSDGLSIA